MKYRLDKIYTRRGDAGSTSISDGSMLSKDSTRISALGMVDELNCVIGLLVSNLDVEDELIPILRDLQNRLFDVGGEVATPQMQLVLAEDTEKLESYCDLLNEKLPPLKEFILPGGSVSASHAHHARSVCRRAERSLVSLSNESSVRGDLLKYINRLSDLLFIIARVLARKNNSYEVLWEGRHKNT